MLVVVISVWTRNLTTYCIHAFRSISEQKCEVKLVVHVHAVVVKSDCIWKRVEQLLFHNWWVVTLMIYILVVMIIKVVKSKPDSGPWCL